MPSIHPTACVEGAAQIAEDVEIGPGQVLSRLIRRISSDVKAISLNDAVVALLGPASPGK